MVEQTKLRRDIYECKRPEAFLSNERITAVDSYDNTLILVDTNGFIQTFETDLKPMDVRKQKRYKSEFIKYLPRAHMIAILDDSKLQIMTRDLGAQPQQTILNRKINSFCLNMAVYRGS